MTKRALPESRDQVRAWGDPRSGASSTQPGARGGFALGVEAEAFRPEVRLQPEGRGETSFEEALSLLQAQS